MTSTAETRSRTERIKQLLTEGKTVIQVSKIEDVTPSYIYNNFQFQRRTIRQGKKTHPNVRTFAPDPIKFTQELASVGFEFHYSALRHKRSGKRFDLKAAFADHPTFAAKFWSEPVWWLMNYGQYLKACKGTSVSEEQTGKATKAEKLKTTPKAQKKSKGRK